MSKQFTLDPKLDFAIERFIDAPTRLVWEALTKPEHLKEWYMPRAWGRVGASMNRSIAKSSFGLKANCWLMILTPSP